MHTLKRLTPEADKCFFGYYDKNALSDDESRLLFHRVDFQERAPGAADPAEIGVLDIPSGKSRVIGRTFAWNFQQGAMLQWLPGGKILYNVRDNGSFAAKIVTPGNGDVRKIARPVSAVSRDGKYAFSLNFARLATHRPGYGYEGVKDEFAGEKWPADDGLYLVNLETGEQKLIVTIRNMLGFRSEEGIEEAFAWFNHTLFAPGGEKFVFLNRWRHGTGRRSRLFCADADGKNLRDLLDTYLISHFDWRNDKELAVWAEVEGEAGFYIVDVTTGKTRAVHGDVQRRDGHCSFGSDERFMLLDGYPLEGKRSLSVFDMESGRQFELGSFYSPPELDGPIRCDLHPRWSASQEYITFDSAHEGGRGVYLMECSDLLEKIKERG